MSNDQEIIAVEVDVRGASSVAEETQRIESVLKRNGIKKVNKLLYTGVDGNRERIAEILNNGIAGGRNTTYAHTVKEMLEKNEVGEMIPLEYADMHDDCVLLVYDPEKLTDRPRDINDVDQLLDNHEYRTADEHNFRDALLAIVRLKTGLL